MTKQNAVPKSGLSNIVAEWLWAKLQQWVDLGVISPEQKNKIQDLYLWPPNAMRPAAPAEPASPANPILALEIIGALLIGIGLITFIAFNWPQLGNAAKLSLVLSLIAGIHLCAYFMAFHSKYQTAGQALVFLGNLAYGAGIWLVAQIYHLPPSFPQGMLIWALGVLPMVFVYRSQLNYFLAVGLFIVWTQGESVGFQTPQPMFLVVLLGVLVPLAYYLKSRVGLAICLLTGSVWLYLNLYLWADLQISAFLLLPLSLYGLLLLALSNVHEVSLRLHPYQPIYRVLGALILGAVILAQPFYGIWAMDQAALSLRSLSWMFWLSSGFMLATSIAVMLAVQSKSHQGISRKIQILFPYLAAASLYWLVLPLIKFSALPGLLGPVLVLLAPWTLRRLRATQYWGIVYGLFWLAGMSMAWEKPIWFIFLIMLYGAGIYLYGWLLRKHAAQESGQAFNLLGLLAVLIPVFGMTFHGINQELFRHLIPVPANVDFWIITGLLYVGWLVGAFLIIPYRHPKIAGGLLPEERALAVGLGLAPLAMGAAVCIWPLGNGFTFSANAVLLLLAAMFLITGYRRRETHLKVLGFALIYLVVSSRFFESGWSLLYKSLLLVSTGIVILGVGIFFEKNKEKVAVID